MDEMMKKEYDLIRKSRGFFIRSINDQAMSFATQPLLLKKYKEII